MREAVLCGVAFRCGSVARRFAKDQSVNAGCRLVLRVMCEVRVDAEGDTNVTVTESLANHLDVLPVVEE